MADVSQIVLKDTNGNVIGTYDVKDATVPHTSESASSGGTTLSLVTTGEKATWNAKSDTDTTYTFANGTNGFTVTPSGGSAQTVTVTPSITKNITGSGSNAHLAKFDSNNTITNGPAFNTATGTYLKNDGTWATPPNTNDSVSQTNTTTGTGYPLLFSYTADNITRTEGARKNLNIRVDPSTGNIKATTFNGYTLGAACAYSATTSVVSGGGALVTSGGVYNAFTSRIKRTVSNRYFTSKTTMSYTGLSLTCPSGHVYVVQAWFRYANGSPRRVGACHLNTVFAFYDSVAASLDTYDCGNGSVTFMMYPGETIYYWAMYYNATQNFITENILDITL